ncbi:uncharacterized protein LOC108218519 isoform X2 [Daucus carota subsp. sativus]|uniref:uncharacterized protein LOC108218519 isoform X2 n=1 Tax=Daucus carota subsp. sativus TaxID=79200 RepID=UPI0030832D7F
MEYERIQNFSLISPTKLRMKPMGHQRKIDDSDIKSARTHPQLQDIEFVENSLLASNVDYDEQVCNTGNASLHSSLSGIVSNGTQGDQSSFWLKEFTSGTPYR